MLTVTILAHSTCRDGAFVLGFKHLMVVNGAVVMDGCQKGEGAGLHV